MGRTVRAVVFIIPIIVFCTAVSSASTYLASRFGLTRSREQVPLTALHLGNEGKVELPGRGKAVEGNGQRLKNSRDSYTLALGNAVVENAAEKSAVEKDISEESTVMENTESPRPGIDITGGLTIGLKEGSGSWIRSGGAGIRIHSGILVTRGKESLDIEAGTAGTLGSRTGNSQTVLYLESRQLDIKGICAGISCSEMDVAGGTDVVLALGQSGVGLYSCKFRVKESEGEIAAGDSCMVVLIGGNGGMKLSIKADKEAVAGSGNVRVVGLDAARLENTTGYEGGVGGWMEGAYSSLLTYLPKNMVTYNEDTFCFDGSAKTIRFAAR